MYFFSLNQSIISQRKNKLVKKKNFKFRPNCPPRVALCFEALFLFLSISISLKKSFVFISAITFSNYLFDTFSFSRKHI